MRSVVLAIAVVLGLVGTAGTAEARRGLVVVTYGTDYVHIRDVPEKSSEYGMWQLGYRYHHWGLFGLDLARTDGEFVLYRDDFFMRVSDEEVEELGGASVPWKYRIPLGWIVIAAAIELALVIWKRRRVVVVLYLAGAMGVLSIVFLVLGLSPEFLIPAALAGHHAIGSLLAIRLQRRIEAADRAVRRDLGLDEPPPPPERRFVDAPLPPPPRIGDDPFRAPPMAKPIVTEKPPERPSTAPIVHDANAEQPKLLR